MSKKKQVTKIPVPRNMAEFRETIITVTRLHDEENSAAGAAAAIHAEAVQAVSSQVSDLQAEAKKQAELKGLHLEAAGKYALGHIPEVFGERQSAQIGTAECGYKLTPHRVATDNDDIDPVEELGKTKAGKAYVRSKPSLDKARLLADYRSGELTDDDLAKVGLAVVQDTVFFVRLGSQVLETIT